MEGIFFLLIGAAIFSQAGHVLGLYSEGRTIGVLSMSLGLLTLGTFMLGTAIAPTLISGDGTAALMTALAALVMLWATYSLAVGAQSLWDMDTRPIGVYSFFLAIGSLVVFLIFALSMAEGGVFEHGTGVWLAMSVVPLILTIISSIIFFHLTFQLQALRLVSGWAMLLGGAVVGIVGLWGLASAIT
ncbi:MAG: hypothetical protein F4X98_15705 [Gammaproteobacteria bacterium]|nr:hypothetical protein [Chloroflexota bacterium]MYD98814.1 hypothetical protein [Gammaproteobacteria bacterium]